MGSLTVGEFLEKTEKVFNTITVNEDETIRDIVEKMINNRADRVVYVVDERNRLKGVISLGDLSRHYFSEGVSHNKGIYPSASIIHSLTAETAKDIMKTGFFSVKLNDDLDNVLNKMIMYKVLKVIPVIDDENRLVSSLDILDIIEFRLL